LAAVVTLKGTLIQIFDEISPATENDVASIIEIYINGIKK
jgi:hypothetical protein